MRKFFVLLICFALLGCGADEPKVNPEPELSPICPEGYHWIDTIKACEILDQEMIAV